MVDRGHTAGEWFTSGDGIVRVRQSAGIMSNPPLKLGSGWREDAWCDAAADDEVRANARLIAAAPALLEALKPFAEACTISSYDDADVIDDTLAANKITWGQLRAARAAIALALAGSEVERG